MTPSKPPIVRPTRTLPFDQLPWDDFERLCLMLLPHEGFENIQHYGAAGSEQGRDIVAHCDGELWYVQCKRVKQCGPRVLLDEIAKIQGLMEDVPDLRPVGLLFIAACDVRAAARDCASSRCKELGLACEVWGRTDLDARVQPHPDIVRTFFGFERRARPIGIPFQAPPLPAHFVPRPEVSDDLKARLLASESTAPGVLVVSAIHGLGGIGKSTLAAALTYDPEVQARFPDGVLWAVLSQQPEVLSLLVSWVQALGDYEYRPSTVEVASAHLRTLLQDKACLLVVDDAWQANHMRPFLVGGTRCRVLITTREAHIALAAGADLYDLNVMTPEQALALLGQRLAYRLTGSERETALELAAEVGYLPLALELAAAQIVGGVLWVELLADLQAEIARLETLDVPGVEDESDESVRKRLSLLASFYLSLQRLPREKWNAFAWLGVLPEDVTLTPMMVATVWETEMQSARDALRYLRNKALLMPGVSLLDGTPTYRLHDLLHDVARRILTAPLEETQAKGRPGLGLTLTEAHAFLLERYRAKTQNGLWHTLPDDDYIHTHLTWHLEQARWSDPLYALLCEETAEGQNGWYEARERLGQTAGYLADVARAWRMADAELQSQQNRESVGLCVRYALITASVNSLAKNIHPCLLVALVQSKIWPTAQGLAYARQVPVAEQRAEALLGLAQHLSEPLRERLLYEALIAAQKIRQEDVRAEMLSRLVSHLANPLRGQALQGVLEALREIENYARWARVFLELAPQLMKSGHPETVLTAVWEIGQSGHQIQGLVELALHSPEFLREQALQEALTTARTIHDMDDQARMLSEMIPHLSGALREQTQQEALTATGKIYSANDRARMLSKLIPHLSGQLRERALREALTAASKIDKPYDRARILSELIDHLPRTLRRRVLRETLTLAREIGDPYNQAQMLLGLIPHLSKSLRKRALREALTTAGKIQSADDRARVFSNLIPRLPRSLREQAQMGALTSAEEIYRPDDRARVFSDLIPRLPESLREHAQREALTAAHKIDSAYDRPRVFSDLIPRLPESLREHVLQEALTATWEVQWGCARAHVLAALLSHLSESLREQMLQEALTSAREIHETYDWVQGLSERLSHLTKGLREQVLREASKAVLEIHRTHDWMWTLSELLFHLPESLRERALQKALTAAQSIHKAYDRVQVLAELIPCLPWPLREQAVYTTQMDRRHISFEDQTRMFVELVPYLPGPMREQVLSNALETLQRIENESRQADLFLELAPQLPNSLLHKASQVARGFGQEQERFKVLAVLPPSLSGSLLREALTKVRLIDDDSDQVNAIMGLVPYLPSPNQEQVLPQVLTAVQSIPQEQERIRILSTLIPHLPQRLRWPRLREVLIAAQGVWNADDWARVIREWSFHWPAQEREQALQEIWITAGRIESSDVRARVLLELAHCLPDTQRKKALWQALNAAQSIPYTNRRACALAMLAPFLPESLLREVVTLAPEVWNDIDLVRRLVGVVPYLPHILRSPTLSEVLAATPMIWEASQRFEVLVRLVPHLPAQEQKQALQKSWEAAREIQQEQKKLGAFLELASCQSGASRREACQEALEAAKEVLGADERAEALARVACRLAEVGYHKDALSTARMIESEPFDGKHWQVKALAGMITHFPEKLREQVLQEALTLVQGMGKTGFRAEALAILVPHLIKPDRLVLRERARPQLGEGQETGLLHRFSSVIRRALRPEITQQAPDQTSSGPPSKNSDMPIRSWQEAKNVANLLHFLANRSRRDILSDLRILSPAVVAAGGEDAAVEILRAIQDVGCWWP